MNSQFKKILDQLKFLRSLSVKHWRYLFKKLTEREINLILFWLGLGVVALFFLAGYDYWILSAPAPANGGQYSEGIVGEPHYLNPVVASASEVDKDITTLIFSGLLKHDPAGRIVPDLAESYSLGDDNKSYEFTLRDKLTWPDKTPFTVDDVIFTINLIQDPRYQSPLRNNWQGVKLEKIDDRRLVVHLPVEYEPFLESATLGILPKHLWSSIQPQNFLLSQLNTKPIGLGQYELHKITKNAGGVIRSMELTPNPYYPQPAHISNLTLRFYDDQTSLIDAFKRREVEGFSLTSTLEKESIKSRNITFYNLELPRYFAVFFNQDESTALAEFNIRKALAYATDRPSIVGDILKNDGDIQYGPFSYSLLDVAAPDQKYDFNLDTANSILDKAGWKKDDDGIRAKKLSGQKNLVKLEFTLTTTDWPELTQVASALKKNWESLGATVNLDIVPVNAVQSQTIRPRDYQALLFGEVLGLNPDPFSFWHSTQRKDPGLNLALYSNKKVDGLLESARQIMTPEDKIQKYESFQNIIMQDIPAVFLYSPNYIYAVADKVQGMSATAINTPSQRFENINQWYINTKRVKR